MDVRELVSFGDLVKTFRKKQHFSQQALSVRLGVHLNTISKWERGMCLPDSKGMVLELAKRLRLDEHDTRVLLEASLTALSPYWSVPYQRNPFFTGREEILDTLRLHLGVEHVVALTQSYALQGLGGIGKTQIALEYAYRYGLEYSAVFWIGAETVEQILSGMRSIAELVGLPERAETDQQRVVAVVQRWLATHSQWLLIWDNLEDLALLHRFLPPARLGTILITTRHQALGTLTQSMDLLPMEHIEGMLFLLRRAKMLGPQATGEQIQQQATNKPDEYAAAAELVTAMGGLPLALDQAGAYLEETQCGLPAYLELFRTRRTALLQQRGGGSQDHPASVATTFRLSITATAQRHPAVWDLLRVCALLQPDAIPEEIFRQGAEHLGVTLEAICRDRLEWNQVVAVAYSYSLLSRQPEEQTLSLHRLVQTVLLDALSPSEQEQWSRRAIGALDAVFPDVLPETEHAARRQAERLLPHALLCLRRAGATLESLVLASLAYKAAQYLRECGRYTEAEPLALKALSLREQILGPDHPDVATSLNYLAVLFRRQGKYVQAEPLLQRTLSIREQVLGFDHPEVARVLNNLAVLCWEQGKYAEAEPFHQRALSVREQSLGPGHPLVASTLNNLAEIYIEHGKDAEAESLMRRALRILEQSLGPSHPLVASTLNGLANLSRAQSKYAETELIFQRALSIREQHLGQHHPETAQTLHDLAVFYQKQGRLSEAFSLVERALTIRLHSLGDAHPKTVATQALSAQLAQEQACPEQTLSAENDPLEGFLDVCCELHPRAWCRINELWHRYERWADEHQERFPLSRRAFAAQLKARGCSPDRTSTMRIWRGIMLVNKDP
jgi:tetratricopeptide (TPR) repeat protein/DNA-binding XRE family transcriptional regulator